MRRARCSQSARRRPRPLRRQRDHLLTSQHHNPCSPGRRGAASTRDKALKAAFAAAFAPPGGGAGDEAAADAPRGSEALRAALAAMPPPPGAPRGGAGGGGAGPASGPAGPGGFETAVGGGFGNTAGLEALVDAIESAAERFSARWREEQLPKLARRDHATWKRWAAV